MKADKAKLSNVQFTNVNMELSVDKGVMSIGNGVFDFYGGTGQFDDGRIVGIDLLLNEASVEERNTEFTQLTADIIVGAGVVRLEPLSIVGTQGITVMSAVVQLADKSFSVSPDGKTSQEEALSGSYGPEGLDMMVTTLAKKTCLPCQRGLS